MYRKKCRECHTVFDTDRKFRKFCSTLCYGAFVSRTKKVAEVWGKRKRTEYMATGIHGKEQMAQLARKLNATNAPQMEKEVILGDLVRQTRINRQSMTARHRAMSRNDLRLVRKNLIKNPSMISRGPNFCNSCGVKQVDKPFSRCQTCIEATYTEQDKLDAIEPFNRVRDDEAV